MNQFLCVYKVMQKILLWIEGDDSTNQMPFSNATSTIDDLTATTCKSIGSYTAFDNRAFSFQTFNFGIPFQPISKVWNRKINLNLVEYSLWTDHSERKYSRFRFSYPGLFWTLSPMFLHTHSTNGATLTFLIPFVYELIGLCTREANFFH